MFLLGHVPRNLMLDAGRGGYHARLSRIANTDGGRFTIYNPPAPAGPPLLLITGLFFQAEDEAAEIRLGRSGDTAALDGLANQLDATTAIANYFGEPLDLDTVLNASAETGFAPSIDGTFWQAASDTDSDKNVFFQLDYPLVLPPGNALIVSTDDAVSNREDRMSWRWFRT